MTPSAPPSRRGFLALAAAWVAGAWAGARPGPAAAQSTQNDATAYIGELRLFAGSVPPSGWAFCHGQILAIASNETLYQLIGTSYGGDGQNTFALPDLRGRAPVHAGNGFDFADRGGAEVVGLLATQIPAHTHLAGVTTAVGTSADPAGRVAAKNAAGVPRYAATANTVLAPGALLETGASAPHTNMQPWAAIHYMIALEGIFPTPV